jgi:hypothetical protein
MARLSITKNRIMAKLDVLLGNLDKRKIIKNMPKHGLPFKEFSNIICIKYYLN